MAIKPKFYATVARPQPDGSTATFKVEVVGRTAWCLLALLQSGRRGCTPIDRPAPRWSHYVWVLRTKLGVNVVTHDEPHPGAYSGSHARYQLLDEVTVGGGNLDTFLASPEGREFARFSFARAA